MIRGEVWLVKFPVTDGNEQSGTRPSIIVRKVEGTNVCLVLPLTTNLHALRFPYTLAVSSDKENGLAADSVALIFQLRAIDVRRLKKKIGSLKPAVLKRIKGLLTRLLPLGLE